MARWICTTDGEWYVYETHGVRQQYVSWVTAAHRIHAARFEDEDAQQWVQFFEKTTGKALRHVPVSLAA